MVVLVLLRVLLVLKVLWGLDGGGLCGQMCHSGYHVALEFDESDQYEHLAQQLDGNEQDLAVDARVQAVNEYAQVSLLIEYDPREVPDYYG